MKLKPGLGSWRAGGVFVKWRATVTFGFDFAAATATDGGSSVWSVRGGAADGLYGASNDMQIWCVLLFGAELSLLFGGIRPRRSRSSRMRWSYRRGAYCGVWVLRSGGVPVRSGLQAGETGGGICCRGIQVGCPDRFWK